MKSAEQHLEEAIRNHPNSNDHKAIAYAAINAARNEAVDEMTKNCDDYFQSNRWGVIVPYDPNIANLKSEMK